MPLLQRHIDELKRIHLAETGENLSDEEAWAMAHRLVGMLRLVSPVDGEPEGTNCLHADSAKRRAG